MNDLNLSLRWDALREQQRLRELPYYTNPEDEKYGQLINQGVFAVQELPPRIARENKATMNFEQAQQLFEKLDESSSFDYEKSNRESKKLSLKKF